MQNPLGKSCHLQPSNGLKSGVLSGGEGGMVEVKLGLEGEDVFIELAVPEDFGVKPPVVKVPYRLSELLILNGRTLEGFPDPEGENLRWIERRILGGGINLFDVGEVARPVVFTVPCDTPIVKLFDPFCGDIRPFSEGDGERGEPIVSDIPIWSLDEGLLIVEEAGLGELEVFFQLFDGRFVFCGLGPCLAEILLMAAVRSFDEGVDNGAERGWVQVSGCDGISR